MSTFTPNPKPVVEQTPREIDEQLSHWYEEHNRVGFELRSAEDWFAREEKRGLAQEIRRAREAVKKLRREREEIMAAEQPLHAEFTRRGGWKRYFLVPKGHVHRERDCHTCKPRTVYIWLPTLSDCNESAMVEEHGDAACAECFPDVQTHPAFIAGKAAREAHELALLKAQCPGSRKLAGSGRGYARCTYCKRMVPVTRSGNLRQHFPLPLRDSPPNKP